MNISGNKTLPRPVLLALMLTFLFGSVPLSPLAVLTSPTTYAALKGDSLKGKVVSANGKPVSGAQVQLLSPRKTMMDVTVTGKDGKFTLDLGVLEDEEMAILDKFKVVVSKKDRKTEKGLNSGASSADGVVSVENIELK